MANVLQYQVVETEEKHPASNAETKRLKSESESEGRGTSIQSTEVPSICILCASTSIYN